MTSHFDRSKANLVISATTQKFTQRTRQPMRRLVSGLMGVSFALNCFYCQTNEVYGQDPFGDPGFGTNPSLTPAAPPSTRSALDPNETNAVVRSLRGNPPTTPKEFGKALDWMTRIRRWDEAGAWLDEIAKLPLDGPSAIEILQSAGARAIGAIESNPKAFRPEHQQTIAKLRQLADQEIHSPANLQRHVIRLTSPDQAERLRGYDGLRAAGDSGIAAILNAVMRPNGLVPTPSMVEAYSLLGPQTTKAWQAAMTTQNIDSRERLIRLVNRSPQADMGPELLAALHDQSISQATRQGISDSLIARGKSIPNAKQSYEYAATILDRSLDQYRQLTKLNDVRTQTTWALGEDATSVQPTSANAAELALARASQAAITTLRSESSGDAVSAKAIVAMMEKLSHEGSRDLTASEHFQSLVPSTLRDSHEFACLIWDAAEQESLRGAKALAVSNLVRWQGKLMPPPVRDRLVQAANSGDPQVRYPATIALMNSLLDQRQLRTVSTDSNVERTTLTSSVDRSEPAGFQGASRVDFVGREMQRLMADPMVMIVGASPSLRSHMHQLVEQMGFRYVEASSVDDVFNTLRNATPVEAIFILDHLRDLDLGQLVQRIRINPSTSTVPIALLADSLSSLEHSVANSDPGVIVGSVPPTIDGFGDIVHRMDDVLGYPRTTAADRVGWKENAANYFRQRFPQEEVTDGTGVSIRLADTQAEQQNLLRIASDAQEPAKRREQASQIFVQSVQRFGLLISTDMINGQYDVYNTRGETEPVTRIVVGRVLDAIDAEYGRQTESNP
jgi:CheY-like chemotaxis protein